MSRRRTPPLAEAEAERARAKRAYDRAPVGMKTRRLVELQDATRAALEAERASARRGGKPGKDKRS